MADISGITAGLAASVNGTDTTSKKKKNGEVGKDEFLTMLIAQLKSQDPLDPMKSEEFAVNLAQFTQVEQLTKINETLTGMGGDTTSGNLASYLGQEVSTDTDAVGVSEHAAGNLKIDLSSAVKRLTVSFKDESGRVVGTKEFNDLPAGINRLPLTGLSVPDGEYSLGLESVDSNGLRSNVHGMISGIVSGFVPGPDAKLILGNREVSPSDVKEVTVPPSN